MTKISVVMITCDGARWIDAQARSIAAQSRPPDEVIIADDASSDDTVARSCRAMAGLDKAPTVLTGSERLGVTPNLERGLLTASGDVIVLADQDDVWLRDKLLTIDRWAKTSTAGALFSDGWLIDADGRRSGERLWERAGFSRKMLGSWHDDPLSVLLRQPVVTGAALALRRTGLDLVLPLPREGWHDHSIALLLAATSGIDACESPLIEYRLHGANTAGLAARSRRQRVVGRDEHRDNLRLQILQLEAIRQRLEAHGHAAAALPRLRSKIDVLSRRAEMPMARPLRMPGALTLLAGGRYHRYAQGWASAARDVLWP